MIKTDTSYEIDGKRLSQKKRPELLVLCRRLHEGMVLAQTAARERAEDVATLTDQNHVLQSNTTYMKGERDKAHAEIARLLGVMAESDVAHARTSEKCRAITTQVADLNAALARPAPAVTVRLGLLPWLVACLGYGLAGAAIAQFVYLLNAGIITW